MIYTIRPSLVLSSLCTTILTRYGPLYALINLMQYHPLLLVASTEWNRLIQTGLSRALDPTRSDPQVKNSFTGRFYDTAVGVSRRLLVSKVGFLGMGPDNAQKGDLICILFGCNVPAVLRGSANGKAFVLFGECFINEYRSREALRDGKSQERRFCVSYSAFLDASGLYMHNIDALRNG